MKKWFSGALTIAASLLIGTAACAAADILKGTPTIDGKMDDIYSKSVMQPLSDRVAWAGSSVDWSSAPDPATDAKSTTYLLYDDSYLYIFSNITDNDVMLNPDSTSKPENPWDQDVCESWIDFGEGAFKVSAGPFVDYVFGQDTDLDFTKVKRGVLRNASGYTVELAVPAKLKKGDIVYYGTQLNDYCTDGYMRCYGPSKGELTGYTMGSPVK